MLTVILTGGQSRRMGRDKALLPCGDQTMLQTLIDRYLRKRRAVAVSVDGPGRFPCDGALELIDAFPGMGPLNGLYSAFTRTKADCVLLTATDLPNGDPSLAQVLQTLLGDHDACVIRRGDGTLETLFAIYARSCLPAVEACLRSGRRAIRAVLEQVHVRYVEEAELDGWDLARILMNVNTPQDYEKYCQEEKRYMNMVFTRRSIRRFQDQPVESEKIEWLLRAAMQAPSAKNAQPWEFLVVTDEADRAAISEMSEYAHMCRYAPALIVTLGDETRSTDHGLRWPQDLAAATQNILLQAVEEGLGACWCGFYPDEKKVAPLKAYFGLPAHIIPFAVIALGYSDRENQFIDRYLPERIHYGKW